MPDGFRRFKTYSFAIALALMGLGVCAARGPLSTEPTVIFLTAGWCGTCRELAPIVDHAVQGDTATHYQRITLDVDNPSAPEQALKYGITLNGSDLPQVYLYQNGKTRLLYNGRQYHFGHARQVEEKIHAELMNTN